MIRVKFLGKNAHVHPRLGVFKQSGPGQEREQVIPPIPSTFGLSYTMCWAFIYENNFESNILVYLPLLFLQPTHLLLSKPLKNELAIKIIEMHRTT